MFNEYRSIGITGGIGSGKSYISNLLRQRFGIPVYDCDIEAKRLTVTDEEIRGKLIQLVGPEVYNGEKLVRQRLAQYLFANSEHVGQVNAIIHPAVLKDFKNWADRQHKPIVALESAILYESGFNEYVDYVLFVDAPKEIRLDRAMQRDTASAERIKARMQMQYPELHRKLADFIIDNSKADDSYLEKQLKTALLYLRNR
ncbi:MAG: dephospho-CoA kinase [Bacteroidaceae bacterium]|nr:dephospho-CoA kinase [Bacteroidaceae bacterium]